MSILKKANTLQVSTAEFEKIKKDFVAITDSNRYDDLFIQVMHWLRSSKKHTKSVAKMDMLIEELKKNSAFLAATKRVFQHLLNHKDFTTLFTEIGVLNSSSFFGEMYRAFLQKFLPPLPDKHSMVHLLVRAFDKNTDYKYINAIPNNLWVELFKLIGSDPNIQYGKMQMQLLDAVSLLSYRIMSLNFSKDLSQKWRANAEKYSAFMEQNRQCTWLVSMYMDGGYDGEELDKYTQELAKKINECEALIDTIGSNSVLYGTSLEQSYIIAKAKQQIIRMKKLLKILGKNVKVDYVLNTSVLMFMGVVTHLNKNSKLAYVVSQSMGLLAFQVSEHKRETGEHYITTTRKSFYKLLVSAMYGGLIICVAAFLKAVLHYYQFADFWSYFLYGLNYSLAFVLLYLTHSTLATKQPAMTAAALAAAIDGTGVESGSEAKVSIVVARVWRSQFASFIGNLVVVFPVCIGIAIVYNYFVEHQLLQPQSYALDMLHEQHPGKSLSLIFAAITGVFLFLSGIISGYLDNRVIYGNIPARIMEHPGFKRNFSTKTLKKTSNFVRDHLGSVTGNVFLGMALGFAPLIGKFFGIPFDIRHITISAAYYGFGVVGLDFKLVMADWIWVTIGVLAIGFVNFFVSFGLAFFTAMRSRNLTMKVVPSYFRALQLHIKRYPLDFIFPPKSPRTPEQIFKTDNDKNKE